MKAKHLDLDFAAYKIDKQQGLIRVTGNNERTMKLKDRDIDYIVSNQYISDEAVDAGLLLLEKRLNDETNLQQGKINVYSVASCRLILAGLEKTNEGKFIMILPRNLAMTDCDDIKESIKSGKQPADLNAGHFTLVSNLFCNDKECNVFETFGPYRNEEHLLTSNAKKLVKLLCNAGNNPVVVKCIEVCLQEENECGAIAFALAIQLGFYYYDGGLNARFVNVRQHLLSCLRKNALVDFPNIGGEVDRPIENVLFSITI